MLLSSPPFLIIFLSCVTVQSSNFHGHPTMRRRFVPVSWLRLLFLVVAGLPSLNLKASVWAWQLQLHLHLHHNDFEAVALSPGPRRSLMSLSPSPSPSPSPKHSTALIAALDGMIHLVENNTKRVIWSFASGAPIYSSYQAPPPIDSGQSSGFYIDYGDDWELYMYRDRDRLKTLKLSMTIEEFITTTPYISEEGAVTLGTKKTSVFEVDPKTGRLIRTYILSESSANAMVDSGSTPPKLRLQIMRTDYTLKSFAPNSDNVSWNMTVAEIGAALLCQDAVDNPSISISISSGDVLNMKDKLGLAVEISGNIALPLSCQSKALIFRHRNHVLLESRLPLPEAKANDASDVHGHNNMMLPLPGLASNPMPMLMLLSLTLFTAILVGIVVYRHAHVPLIKEKLFSREQATNSNSNASSRKLEKTSGAVDTKDKQVLSETEHDKSGADNKTLLDLNKIFYSGGGGRRIGKLLVSNTEIAKGSNGTIVLEGIYEGRPVAVKRLVQAHHDVAFKEIQNLIASDRHPNIVRWYGVEYDQDFVYLSLERCTCSLDDLIQMYSDPNHVMRPSTHYKVRLESLKNLMPDVNFWKANGQPSSLLLKLMRDAVSGLVHLHELGIIHRDLKPQNVLIIKERSLCAKLSDMGISKRLLEDMSSLGQHATGCGSSGWQAPEQLLRGRQTRAVDLFSLGCVLFFCITGGRHPFGDHLERDINIVKNQVDLFLVESMPEAVDLISRLLHPDPELRPKALEVLHHPLFWSSETRLSFLRDTSDRVELEDRATGSDLLKALESIAPIALDAKWNEKMEPAFIRDIGRYRWYKFDSVRDLLRVMRNKLNHYRELPKEIQELVGSVPDGFDSYFASRFPRLLIEVYKIIRRCCKQEECFQKYFESNVE